MSPHVRDTDERLSGDDTRDGGYIPRAVHSGPGAPASHPEAQILVAPREGWLGPRGQVGSPGPSALLPWVGHRHTGLALVTAPGGGGRESGVLDKELPP